jgi:hypothetical protein
VDRRDVSKEKVRFSTPFGISCKKKRHVETVGVESMPTTNRVNHLLTAIKKVQEANQ